MNEHVFRRHAVSVVLSFALLLISFICVQQGHTISSQRSLIRSLFHDSLELNAIKIQSIQQRAQH